MNEILEGLNPAQREAAECLEGPVLVLAGAGSGKTRTLTHRIANLIKHGVREGQILAVTFTNKAANEMRLRLWRLLYPEVREEPPRSFMPYMGTFHGICVRILHIEADAAGLARNFVIYDADDQVSLVRRIIRDLQMNDDKSLKPKVIQSIISSEKNKGNGPEEYASTAMYPNQRKIAKIFAKYEEEKQKAGALDFDDLLLKTLELFATRAEVRKRWQERFQHILIDEYQDTNVIQYKLVKLLVNKQRNICVVGDDWQSIYSWRGADFTNILNFERDFPGAKVVKLEQNYRSTGNILKASQQIINHNKTRTDKTLFTESGDGIPVTVEGLADEMAEARFVALTIEKLQHNYNDLGDFAVLYRTNAQSYALEKVFVEMHVPYKLVGGVRFYDRKEVKDVLAILHLIVNERDKVSFVRVVKNVLSGIGEVSITKVLSAIDSFAGAEPFLDTDFPEVLRSAKARASLVKLCNFLRTTSSEEAPEQIVLNILEAFNFRELTNDGTPSGEERWQNLEVLASNAKDYENLDDFLADASLMSAADEKSTRESVTLMTLHAAKGLEFPVVFIVGLEEGLFPSSRAMEDLAGLEEERRLAYVGMTRAMDRLYLLYAKSRYSYGTRSYTMPSRFLSELGYQSQEDEPVGSLEMRDVDGDGFKDENVFNDDDFGDLNSDPFPEDLPIYE
ncbi:UvrD-helicase domain-containing protein [Candidatus Saccharibacteria bacterium]|nr:UvrD-helicase domain-containing protein [Candidatus Saccharibacteria bacterium]